VIISHTEHQKTKDGQYVGWGPTVNEINFLSQYWEEVVHVACLEKGVEPRGSSIGYVSDKIKLETIPTFGGRRFWQKLDIFWKMPYILWKVQKSLKNASHVQLRVPMGIGIFLIPYFAIRRKSRYIFWVKYANNWGSEQVPLGYKMQRYLLKKNFLKCKVTINGFWPNQEKHCISFENPCLNEHQITLGDSAINRKEDFSSKEVVFVGRIEFEKGVDVLIEFLDGFHNLEIAFFHVVGDGNLANQLKEVLIKKQIPHKFYGTLTQVQLFEILEKCDAIILPSRSEGFPKVLAEAMNFGCVPICSNVGSIGHYIEDSVSGFILEKIDSNGIYQKWNQHQLSAKQKRNEILKNAKTVANKFTFERYYEKLNKEVFV